MHWLDKYRVECSLFLVITALFGWIVFHTAWLNDDAFISLRQVYNAINGDGFVYNFNQRVQAFTHPAWVLLLTGACFFTRELFYTNLALSMALSMAAVTVLYLYCVRLAGSHRALLVLLCVFILFLGFSRAFTDYMTSGLENPLSYFCIGLIVYLVGAGEEQYSPRRMSLIFLLFAIAFLNRFDYAVLLGPLVLYLTFFVFGFKPSIKASVAGLVLIAGWFTFSVIYFGAPLPNTFYAKLGTGYPEAQVWGKGWSYFEVTFSQDPITLLLIAAAIVFGLLASNRVFKSLAIGLVLYCLYIVDAGGDFMMGRYFAVPVYVSIFIIAAYIREHFHKRYLLLVAALFACAAVKLSSAPVFSGENYINEAYDRGIADERGVYFQRWGLISPNRKWPVPRPLGDSRPQDYKPMCGGIGVAGLENPDIYLIDLCGLTDVLISRLPAVQNAFWRIGHHGRKIPTNYPDYLIRGDALADKSLMPMLEDITVIVSGRIFTLDRFRAIYRLNLSRPYRIAYERYKNQKIPVPISLSP